jgi:hypothetical protein
MKFIVLSAMLVLFSCKSEDNLPKPSNKVSVTKQPLYDSNGVEIIDVKKGNIHYLIFKSTKNIQVVNYTSDSIEYELVK